MSCLKRCIMIEKIDNPRWEAAIVPVGITGEETFTFGWPRTIFMQWTNSADEQKRCYESLLAIPWLAPAVRSAVLNELGRSRQAEKRGIAHARAVTLRFRIDQVKARMRKDGEPPRGGIHAAALAEVAEKLNITVEALTRGLTRDNERQRGKLPRKRPRE
jgi:hypothetical protein